MDDFWDKVVAGGISGATRSMDSYLSGDREIHVASRDQVRKLTDRWRSDNALHLPVDAGARVSFVTNIGTVLTYDDPPHPEEAGTVVTVRSSSLGDVTHHDGMVFVKWDSGKFLPVFAEHLRLSTQSRRANSFAFRVSSLGDLSDFFRASTTESDLVHKATKDLWAFRMEGDDYVIERLFSETGEPIKE